MLGFQALAAGSALAGGSAAEATTSHVGGRIVGGHWTKGKWRNFVASELDRQERIKRKKKQQALLSEQARIEALGKQTPAQKALAAIEAESLARQKLLLAKAQGNAIDARKAAIELAKKTQILSQMQAFARLRQIEMEDEDEEAIALLLDD